MLRLEGLGTLKKNQLPNRESKPRRSGLYHSASTIYAKCIFSLQQKR
jgi:hypothetical protein